MFSQSRERYQVGNRSALALLEANWAMLCLLEKDIPGVKRHLKRSHQQLTQNPIIQHTYCGVQGLTALEQGKLKIAEENLKRKLGKFCKIIILALKEAGDPCFARRASLAQRISKEAEAIVSELVSLKGTPLYDFKNSLLLSDWCYQQKKIKAGRFTPTVYDPFGAKLSISERPDLWLHIHRIRNRFGR